jgi:hypothetical protein
MTNRWLLLNFDALGALSVLVTTLFSIATLTDGAGLAGLCITSAMAFTSSGKAFTLMDVLVAPKRMNFKCIGHADSGLVSGLLWSRILRHF